MSDAVRMFCIPYCISNRTMVRFFHLVGLLFEGERRIWHLRHMDDLYTPARESLGNFEPMERKLMGNNARVVWLYRTPLIISEKRDCHVALLHYRGSNG